jgi:hypothetical protein
LNISTILDVVIGLAAVFFVFSTVASGIHEVITRALATRSKHFWRALGSLLDDSDAAPPRRERAAEIALGLNGKRDPRPLASAHADSTVDATPHALQQFLASDLIRAGDSTKQFVKTRLSHVEPDQFSRALLDVISGNERLEDTAAARLAIAKMPNSKLKREMEALARHSGDEIIELRDDISRWFDVRMASLTRAYRRRTRWWLFAIGLLVAVGFNVNAVRVTNDLYRDQPLRSLVTAKAESLASECKIESGKPDAACQAKIDSTIDTLKLPVWWSTDKSITFWTIVGWIAAAAAIAMGAPFWFDVLRRATGMKQGAITSH